MFTTKILPCSETMTNAQVQADHFNIQDTYILRKDAKLNEETGRQDLGDLVVSVFQTRNLRFLDVL